MNKEPNPDMQAEVERVLKILRFRRCGPEILALFEENPDLLRGEFDMRLEVESNDCLLLVRSLDSYKPVAKFLRSINIHSQAGVKDFFQCLKDNPQAKVYLKKYDERSEDQLNFEDLANNLSKKVFQRKLPIEDLSIADELRAHSPISAISFFHLGIPLNHLEQQLFQRRVTKKLDKTAEETKRLFERLFKK